MADPGPILDAHVHVATWWYEPIERLIEQLDANGIWGAILVEEAASTDPTYLFTCASLRPGRFGVVVNVDATRPDASEVLRRLAARGATGVRLASTARGPDADPLAVWRTAAELGLAITCHGVESSYLTGTFREAVGAAAGVPVVIEHLAGRSTLGRAPAALEQRLQVLAVLAAMPDVHVKFHGLGEFARRARGSAGAATFREPVPRLLEQAADLFGVDRMLWGSDFPPVSAREGYRNALRLPMERLVAHVGDDALRAFGSVAARVFGLVPR